MNLDYALKFPVLTIGSGPANSMRGAAYLSGVTDAIVVDVGGTSSDVGVLVNGFPRESTQPVTVGGVRTNFRMPDLVSVAIGGGTVISTVDGQVSLGPRSVGFRITEHALVFGGQTPTLTDAAVAAGRVELGHLAPPPEHLELLEAALRAADEVVTAATEQMKTSRSSMPLVAVGGGSGLLPRSIDGVGEILRPENYDVANAIGAAIATVSGQVDRVYKLSGTTRDEIRAMAMATACDEAISAGADPNRVEVVEVDEVPVAYLTEPVIRIRVRAAGPLDTV